ncbi:FMN-binding protein [Enterococcus malodoratus]|uniref:FMN-binding protein n=1 Tax=Enterococcus malodoratus TaxID=71451 RepID=UPI003FD176F7
MKKKVRIMLLIGLVVFVLLGGYGLFYYQRVLHYKQAVQSIHFTEPDLTEVEDGEYIGEHDVDFIRAKVKVSVKDQRFTAIKMLEHYNDRGEKADALPEKMLEQQKISVDAVSGATNSSKVIQKAVEKALIKE